MLDQELRLELSYKDIPHFPPSTGMFCLLRRFRALLIASGGLMGLVVGHAGKFVFGFLGERKTPVVVMMGRAQYEFLHSCLLGDFRGTNWMLWWDLATTKATRYSRLPFLLGL